MTYTCAMWLITIPRTATWTVNTQYWRRGKWHGAGVGDTGAWTFVRVEAYEFKTRRAATQQADVLRKAYGSSCPVRITQVSLQGQLRWPK